MKAIYSLWGRKRVGHDRTTEPAYLLYLLSHLIVYYSGVSFRLVHRISREALVNAVLKFRGIASKQGSALVHQDKNDPKIKLCSSNMRSSLQIMFKSEVIITMREVLTPTF